MSDKPTAGSWTAERDGGGDWYVEGPSWVSESVTGFDGYESSYLAYEADAHQIAASPEMRAALETVVRVIESDEFKAWEGLALTMVVRNGGKGGYTGEQFMPAVKAALAKAEGRDAD